MSRTKFDNITRSALWSSYNNICFYCTRPLDWEDLHIEHIIPEYFSENENEFNKLKIEYNLNQKFSINDLVNLVPTHSKCNQRKSNTLFPKETILYYFGLTTNKKSKIESEIEKIKKRKNRGQIISKLQSALSTNLISQKELKKILIQAEENNWNIKELKLPFGIEFLDEIYDTFYFNTDYTELANKQLVISSDNYLELSNDDDLKMNVSTLNEWKDATKQGFYPLTTYAIKLSSHFTFLDELISILEIAKMPKVSFISEPWFNIENLDILSPNILHDFENQLEEYSNKDYSVGDLVKKGIVKVNKSNPYQLSLEFNGMETSFIEQFRADFNNDGIEDIFIRGWTRAIGGTLGYGFTTIFTKYSEKHLIEEIK
jgi:hypothetical protein